MKLPCTKKGVIGMKKKFMILLAVVSLVSMFSMFASGASEAASPADKYPVKPVQVIVGYGSGGDADVNARIFSKHMEKFLGKTLVVSNITGAAGSVGARQVLESKPDGYVVLFSHWGSLMNTLLGIGEYNLLEDFEIAGIGALDTNTLLVGNANGRFADFNELIAYAKENPNDVRCGIEVGSVVHLTSSVLQAATGTKLHLVDTGNMGNDMAALKSNQTDFAIRQFSNVKDYIAAGDFKGFAYLNDERNEMYPDVPAITEFGIDGMAGFYSKFFWYGFPKGTPKAIVDKFAAAMKQVVEDPQAQKEFAALGVSLKFMDGAESKKFISVAKDTFEPFLTTIK